MCGGLVGGGGGRGVAMGSSRLPFYYFSTLRPVLGGFITPAGCVTLNSELSI